MCSGPLLAGSDPRRRGGAWDPPLGCGTTLERVEGKEGGRGVRLPPHPLLPPPPAFSFLLLNAKCKNNFYIFYFFSLLFQEEQPRFQSAVRLLLSISFSFPFSFGPLLESERKRDRSLLFNILVSSPLNR